MLETWAAETEAIPNLDVGLQLDCLYRLLNLERHPSELATVPSVAYLLPIE